MTSLMNVEKAFTDESARWAHQGDYDAARKYLSLAERTRSLRTDADESRATPELRNSLDLKGSAPVDVSQFPRFWVERDVLRKQGLGRDGKSTYVHGIPKGEFEKVVAKLKEIAARQGEFEVRGFVASMKMPDYHPYIVLATLENLHLLESRKRGVMNFADRSAFQSSIDGAWSTIAGRPNPTGH